MQNGQSTPVYPWHEKTFIRGNFTVGNLRENLPRMVTHEGRIQAETLLAAVGVLTGFTAQNAALIKAEKSTQTDGHANKINKNGIVLIGTNNGYFLLGDDINAPLFGEGRDPFPLRGFAAGAAQAGGINVSDLPSVGPIASRVVSTLGTSDFGKIQIDKEHQPHLSSIELLKILWPNIYRVFHLPLPSAMPPDIEPPLDETHWPVMLSLVTNQLMGNTNTVLNPLIGYQIVMESAIIGAKIDPNVITPNKWLFETSNGELRVKRNPDYEGVFT